MKNTQVLNTEGFWSANTMLFCLAGRGNLWA